MLPKKFRTTVPGFALNSESSKSYSASLLNVVVKKSNISLPQFVIVVPKRLDKRATLRHLTKRIIVEVLRVNLSKIKGGVDILIKAKKIIRKEDRVLLRQELSNLFKKSGLSN